MYKCWITFKESVEFWKKPPNCFPKWSYDFAFPPSMAKNSHWSTFSTGYFLIWYLWWKVANNFTSIKKCISRKKNVKVESNTWILQLDIKYFNCNFLRLFQDHLDPLFLHYSVESRRLTCTEQVAAITPSTGVSEKGSNVRSGRLMKSGLRRYLVGQKHRRSLLVSL